MRIPEECTRPMEATSLLLIYCVYYSL